jgi:hypothetical protein
MPSSSTIITSTLEESESTITISSAKSTVMNEISSMPNQNNISTPSFYSTVEPSTYSFGFFIFGDFANDSTFYSSDDGSTSVFLLHGFRFFGIRFNSIYVSN